MEYIPLFFFGWLLLCLPALIVTAVTNSRRRRETAELNDKVTALTRQLENLERRSRADAGHVQPAAASAPMAAPAVKISVEETRPVTAAPSTSKAPEPVIPKPAPPIPA